MSRRITTKKLLVASIGVASMSYAVACKQGHPPGNLMPPRSTPDVEMMDAGQDGASIDETKAPVATAPTADPLDAGPVKDVPPSTGNYMQPPKGAPTATQPKATKPTPKH